MTNKQAIEKLNDIRCHVKEASIEEQALVMAIEALKKAGIYGDIIYREDALMCLTGEYPADFKHDELIAKFIRRIRKLPSAQPEAPCYLGSPCEYQNPDAEIAQLSQEGTTKDATSDLISRKDAIDAVNNAFDRETLLAGFVRSIAVRAIRDMPSAQPEPKWIPCSEKLPEESGYYIVTAHDGAGHRTTFVKYQKKAKSWDLTGARSYWRVIAWMPLPELYKGEIE